MLTWPATEIWENWEFKMELLNVTLDVGTQRSEMWCDTSNINCKQFVNFLPLLSSVFCRRQSLNEFCELQSLTWLWHIWHLAFDRIRTYNLPILSLIFYRYITAFAFLSWSKPLFAGVLLTMVQTPSAIFLIAIIGKNRVTGLWSNYITQKCYFSQSNL